VFVCPGHRLGDAKSMVGGPGTYELDGCLYASIVGQRLDRKGRPGQPSSVEVVGVEKQSAHVVPAIHDIVTAKVMKVNERVATVDILLVGSRLLKENYSGSIKKRDVRKFEVDSVEMYRMFRPGDIIRAQVISLGDSKSYYLSTAKNELGVVLAQSTAGHIMVPISWEQMQCPVTQAKEFRKVAKVEDQVGPASSMSVS